MLVEISCQRFRQGAVNFGPGLNVVLGDEQASNSIGKSTLLMLVDFAHGGDDFLRRSPEVVENLGDHEYIFTFKFDGLAHIFRRSTSSPTVVLAVEQDTADLVEWSRAKYTAWLKDKYSLKYDLLSFRQTVSPYTRVWKRETLDTERPLQEFKGEARSKAVTRLLILFGAYSTLKELELQVESLKLDKKNLENAQRSKFIASINKREYKENVVAVQKAEDEIEKLRKEAANITLSARELVNDEVLEATLEKEELLELRLQLLSQKQRMMLNLDGVGAPKRKAFESLLQFFPQVDVERLGEVEDFHRKLSKILRRELQDEQAIIDRQLRFLDERLAELDERISLATTVEPTAGLLVDRAINIAADAHKRRQANEFYDKKTAFAKELKALRVILKERRDAQTRQIQTQINDLIQELAETVFPAGRRNPRLELQFSKYSYHVDQDTGTGTTFAAVVLLDLALLNLTSLPYVVHDSVFLKNIEVPVMIALVDAYSGFQSKQVFIAIDEAQKYGPKAFETLVAAASTTLSRDNLLYDLDWRQE